MLPLQASGLVVYVPPCSSRRILCFISGVKRSFGIHHFFCRDLLRSDAGHNNSDEAMSSNSARIRRDAAGADEGVAVFRRAPFILFPFILNRPCNPWDSRIAFGPFICVIFLGERRPDKNAQGTGFRTGLLVSPKASWTTQGTATRA